MGTVVIHAGMGKAGSSSVQAWLARHLELLRESGTCLLTVREGSADARDAGVRLEEYRSGKIVANEIVKAYESGNRSAVVASLVEQLDAAAKRNRLAVLSAEAFERFFWRGDHEFLSGLEELARTHQVRVAYYVRPQDTALEAHWRQWGFRSGASPSASLQRRSNALRYFDTYSAMRGTAPNVSFEPRPFRRDLLEAGDPGRDFARTFLAVNDPSPSGAESWSNRGLPLEVVNALRYAPEGLFWSSVIDHRGLTDVKKVLGELEVPESERTARSRVLLQAYCHKIFEAGNRELLEALGWRTDAFVPAPETGVDDSPQSILATLDELWEPRASEAELAALYTALQKAIASTREVREHASKGLRPQAPEGGARARRVARRWLGRRWAKNRR